MPNVTLSPRKLLQRTFYGWWIVAAGCVLQGLHTALLTSGFTIYFIPLQMEFGWSRTLVASGWTLSRVESALFGPLEGWAVDKFGPRRIVLVGLLMFGGGFMLLSRMHSVVEFFIVFGILAIGSSLAGFLPISVAIANWFAEKRALAMGIAMTGMGIGGVVIPALAWSLTNYGWRPTAFASGFVVWLVGVPMALMLRHRPEPYGYEPDGRQTLLHGEQHSGLAATLATPRDVGYIEYSFSAKDALKTSAFWMVSLGHASALLVVSTINLHQVPHMVQQLGMSLEAAGGIVAFMMVACIVGRLAGGFLADRIDKKLVLVACMLGHTLGILFLAYAQNTAQLLLYGTFHGLAWGARAPTQQAIRADYFGRASYGTIMGFSSVVITLGVVSAPVFAGWMADVQGDYQIAFTILAVLTSLGSLFFVFARKPMQPARPDISDFNK